jgi:hypothetical protein
MIEADSVHSTPPLNTSALPDDKPASEAPEGSQDALYIPTDISPDELFEHLGRVRKEAEDAIEQLLDLLDRTDAFYDEREQQVDDDPIDGDDDSEDSLASVDAANQVHWATGNTGDREGDGCADDREGDELEHGGDGALEDGEPSLGWTEEEAGRGGTGGSFMGNRTDFEEAPSTLTAAALARYRQFDRYFTNNDGWHVDAECWIGDQRRIRNLSDRQHRLVKPRIDRRSQVSC